MINTVALVGNLGQDPEIRYLPTGTAVVNLSIAVNEFYTSNGEKQQRTHWFRVVAFQRLAEIIAEYCVKGSKIGIRGQLTSRQWEDNDGNNRITVEVRARELELLGNGKNGAAEGQKKADVETPPSDNDDIPF